MTPAYAQLTTTQNWTSGDYSVSSGASIDVTTGYAIDASGTLGTLANSGSISGVSVAIQNVGTVSRLTNDGTIRGSSIAIRNAGTITVVENNGAILSSGNGGFSSSGVIATIVNNGTLSGGSAGLNNSGSIGSLANFGTISGSSTGVWNRGTISVLTNSGIISGLTGIRNLSVIGTLSNAGLITGHTALQIASSASLGTLINTGTIAGDLINNSTITALNIDGGTGSNFGTLTGYGGTIGAITALSSDVNFLSGNQLLNDNIIVNSGSGTVTNNATLQVNNPLTITGNYYQSTGSSLIFGVTNAVFNGGASDLGYGRLVVSGDVTLAAGSSITLKTLGYAFATGQRYVVVAAGGTITATGVTYSATGYSVTGSIQSDASPSYSGYSDLVLTLGNGTNNGAPANNASNPNAASTLRGLFNYTGTDPSLLAVFNPAAALGTRTAANKAGAQLNPAAVRQAAARGEDAVNNAVLDITGSRLDGLRLAQGGASGVATGVATGERSLAPALWGQFFGGGATQDERDSVSGYHSNYRGLLIGGDLQASDNWRAGALFSYARTNVGNDDDNTGSSASVNTYGVIGYAGYDGKPWYLNLMLGLARQQYSTTRAIGFTGFSGVANGSFNGLQNTASVQTGYPLRLSGDMTLTPLAGLTYNRLRQNGYTETGGSGAALIVQGATTASVKSDIGAKLERRFDTSYGELSPSVQMRWRHEFKDSRLSTAASFAADPSGSTSFTTVGATPVRNTGVMVLGLTLARSKSLSLSANYALEAGRGYLSQTADVRLRWQY